MDYKKEVEELITSVVREAGSDIHVSGGRPPSVRISGELVTLTRRPAYSKDDVLGILKELVPEEKFKVFVETQELDFSYSFRDMARLRGNAYFHSGSASIALRVIPKIKSIRELNLPESLEGFASKKQGFFLVVGPVGQGKTTTLASMVNYINTERKEHIVTIEDPIEYIFEANKALIDQREVGLDTRDFHTALKQAFRQDVDVIMIGEMRNAETISTAVTAAETGHLVLSTLHTNNASQTIDRIIDSFPGDQQSQIRLQLAGSLLGIFSQRLIKRISGGLVPAYELLINNNAVANLIREKKTHEIDVVIETGSEAGMIDLNRSLVDLVRRGEISIEDAYGQSLNPRALERVL